MPYHQSISTSNNNNIPISTSTISSITSSNMTNNLSKTHTQRTVSISEPDISLTHCNRHISQIESSEESIDTDVQNNTAQSSSGRKRTSFQVNNPEHPSPLPTTTIPIKQSIRLHQQPSSITTNLVKQPIRSYQQPFNTNTKKSSTNTQRHLQLQPSLNKIPSHLRSTQASSARYNERSNSTSATPAKTLKACTVLGGFASHTAIHSKKPRT